MLLVPNAWHQVEAQQIQGRSVRLSGRRGDEGLVWPSSSTSLDGGCIGQGQGPGAGDGGGSASGSAGASAVAIVGAAGGAPVQSA